MFPFQTENPEIKFNREQTEKQMNHDTQMESFRAANTTDQVDLAVQNERTDLLKWQQDLDPELQRLIHTLKGEILVNGGWEPRTFWKDGKLIKTKAMCNERFISEVIVPQCTPYLDRNILNTYYEEHMILTNLRNTCWDIKDAMADNYDLYDIDFTNYDLVLRNIINVIKPGVFRALRGFTKKIDSTIIRRVEQSSDANQPEKKSLFDTFKPSKF